MQLEASIEPKPSNQTSPRNRKTKETLSLSIEENDYLIKNLTIIL